MLPASLTVTPAPLSLTAVNASKVAGSANPALTYTVAGLVSGDTAGSAFTGAPALSTTATTSSGAGTYPISIAAGTVASTNYTVSYVPGILTVTAAPPVRYTFELQRPLNPDGSSVVRGNPTVPVKFILKANGVVTTTPAAYFSAVRVSSAITGNDRENLPEVAATKGTKFVVTCRQYQYNWSTKGLASGTYQIQVTLDNGAVFTVNVSLK